MIKLQNADPRPVVRQKVIVNGKPIGEIFETEYGFQCSLKSIEGDYIGGTGKNKEDSFRAAIAKARKQANGLLQSCDEIEQALAGGVTE